MQVLPTQCKRPSRSVKITDMDRVEKEAKEMIELSRMALGRYPRALALAHCQVDHADPLRFFVFNNGRIIINPQIDDFMKEEGFVRDTEGCFSYPFRPEVSIKRYKTLKVSYQEVKKRGGVKNKVEVVDGMLARIFQHELDHFNGKSIYA